MTDKIQSPFPPEPLPSPQWLQARLRDFRTQNTPHRERPWAAWSLWAVECGRPILFGGPAFDVIHKWFTDQSHPESQQLGALYTAAFYFDTCFWALHVPIFYGAPKVDFVDRLESMPPSIQEHLRITPEAMEALDAHYRHAHSYAVGYENLLKEARPHAFDLELLAAARKHLETSVAQMLVPRNANAKSLESSALTCEISMKAMLASKFGFTEETLRREFRHDLQKLADKVLGIRPELAQLVPELPVFPEIAARYRDEATPDSSIWKGHFIAQFLAATSVDVVSG